jgi:hypothetical protein
MAFEKLPDGKGLLYIPKAAESEKKHPCSDCFSCQGCSDPRCRVCRSKPGRQEHRKPKK